MGDDLSYGLNTLGPLCLWQYFVCILKNLNKWSFGDSHLRCFVVNFITDGFTSFLCYFFGQNVRLCYFLHFLHVWDPVPAEGVIFEQNFFCNIFCIDIWHTKSEC